MSPERAKLATEGDDFLKTVYYHEVLESQAGRRFGKLKKMPTGHEASQVLIGEGAFVSRLGNKPLEEMFALIRSGRKEEKAAFNFGKRLFSGFDDRYNIIEGLSHKGIAKYSRKIITDFGSGLNILKATLRAGETFEKLIVSSEWKKALMQGELVKNLGEGTFGITSLYKTQFRGKEIQYVRKTLKEMISLGDGEVISRGEFAKRYSTGQHSKAINLGHEGEVLRQLEGVESIPSFYGQGKSSLFMEYMEGVPLSKYRGDVQEEAISRLLKGVEAASERGIGFRDIHPGNILIKTDPSSGKQVLTQIDMGEAMLGFSPIGATRSNQSVRSKLSGMPQLEKNFPGEKRKVVRAEKKQLESRDLQVAQEQISRTVVGKGSRGHESRKGSFVHLSRFTRTVK
jgi:predicted Ser/Thr protein kinase